MEAGFFRRWWAFFEIYIKDGLAYRVSGFIWILNDAITATFMPLVLAAAAQGGAIQGFAAPQFAQYYLVSLLVTSFVTCHFMWEVAYEVKEGIFSTQIIRPMRWLEFMAARNLAWRVLRSVYALPIFVCFYLAYQGWLQGATFSFGLEFWVSVFFGHALSFMVVMALATLALFFQEANSIFELYYIPMLFLSGQMFPIALFPDWVRTLALWTPFYYTTGLPTEIALGRISPSQAWPLIGVQVLWWGIAYVAYRFGFSRGVKHYTGVGM